MKGSRSARARRVSLVVVAALLCALVVGGGAFALRLRSNITVVDVQALATDRDVALVEPGSRPSETANGEQREAQEPQQPINILVMGSDTREGQGDGFGSAALIDGARSDTTLLVHLAADRRSVTVVSIPRDLVVTLPSCTMGDGTTTYSYQDRFNAAFSIGGPECTIRTVNALTGLPIHHFVVVDFSAFQATIDALGGVEVCLTKAVDDPKAGLRLPAGVSRVDGDQALAFVRARESLGDGSDLARIERQQAFLGSLVREATSRELLTDPVRLIRSLDAATRSVTMDPALAWLPTTVSLSSSLAEIEPAQVSFTTLPYVYNDDLLTVRPDQNRLDLLVDVIAQDLPWPFPVSSADAVAVPPEQVAVLVLNATGRPDRATRVATALGELGFVQAGADTTARQPSTQVRFPPPQREAARTVAAAVEGAVLVPDPQAGSVTLVLGEEFRLASLRTVVVDRASTPGESRVGPDSAWVLPEDSLPSGETTTAQTATCAS
jgi:LCP family protein required for cell wall assembly